MGFWDSSTSGGRIVLLLRACWNHRASKTASLVASLLLFNLQYFRAQEGMLPPGECPTSVLPPGTLIASSGNP